jgi:hypothetical protein
MGKKISKETEVILNSLKYIMYVFGVWWYWDLKLGSCTFLGWCNTT